jgi:predicted thioredoxin/glutaredoxin
VAPGLIVVHRRDCELCDEMVRDLDALRERSHLPSVTLVDVDSDADLVRRYGMNVPVLLLDGTVVCRHRLDVAELLRMLRRAES